MREGTYFGPEADTEVSGGFWALEECIGASRGRSRREERGPRGGRTRRMPGPGSQGERGSKGKKSPCSMLPLGWRLESAPELGHSDVPETWTRAVSGTWHSEPVFLSSSEKALAGILTEV